MSLGMFGNQYTRVILHPIQYLEHCYKKFHRCAEIVGTGPNVQRRFYERGDYHARLSISAERSGEAGNRQHRHHGVYGLWRGPDLHLHGPPLQNAKGAWFFHPAQSKEKKAKEKEERPVMGRSSMINWYR